MCETTKSVTKVVFLFGPSARPRGTSSHIAWTQHAARAHCPSRRVESGGSLAAGARPAMVTMKSGVLVKCDGALKQFILHLDEQKQKEGAGADSFVLSGQEASELDELHLLVKEDALEYIQQAIEDMQAKNSFSRPDAAAQEREANQQPAKKQRKKKEAA